MPPLLPPCSPGCPAGGPTCTSHTAAHSSSAALSTLIAAPYTVTSTCIVLFDQLTTHFPSCQVEHQL